MSKRKKNSQDLLVSFSGEFLNGIYESFRKRSKSLKYRGDVTYEFGTNDRVEWFAMTWTFSDYPRIEVFIDDKRQSNLHVLSRRNSNYGKILCRVDELVIACSADRVEDAFETIMYEIHSLLDDQTNEQAISKIERVWNSLGLKIVGS